MSPFSTLSPNVLYHDRVPPFSRSQSVPHYIASHLRLIPQPRFVPTSKWNVAVCRTPDPRPISFNLKSYATPGVPMRELCTRGRRALAAMIEHGDDMVLAGKCGIDMGKTVSLQIMWPGYDHIEWSYPIHVFTPYGPITRSQLASSIAQNFARFIEKSQYQPMSPHAYEWRVGISGITLDKLVLVALWNVFDGIWQAEVALDVS